MKILVVEDEKDLNNIISKYLKKEGYGVDSALDGEEALDFINMSQYDLILADIMMPRLNGYELVTRLREKNIKTPVLYLTAKDSLDDIVKGLDLGADDYLVKPFEFKELLARIRVLLRRNYGLSDNILNIDNMKINLTKKSVFRNNQKIRLTGKEYEILEYLALNRDRILTKDEILEHVWDFNYEGSSNIIEVLIKNIRKKIDIGNSKPLIFTKRGLGYVLSDKE